MTAITRPCTSISSGETIREVKAGLAGRSSIWPRSVWISLFKSGGFFILDEDRHDILGRPIVCLDDEDHITVRDTLVAHGIPLHHQSEHAFRVDIRRDH
jgi:hypothetical protein